MNSAPRKFLAALLVTAGCGLLTYGWHRVLKQAPVFARISLERTWAKSPGSGPPVLKVDPGFTRTEMEFMRSELVLGKVLRELDLKRQWGLGPGVDEASRTNAALQRLRQHVKLVVVPKTGLVDIHVIGEPPEDAARIANAIADACLLHYRDQNTKLMQALSSSVSNSVAALDEQWSSLGRQIRDVREQLARFRPEPTLSEAATNGAVDPAVLQASNALQVKLDGLQQARLELQQQFIADTPVAAPVACVAADLVRAARPPLPPSRASRFRDGAVIASGLVLCAAGWWVSRPPRRRSPRPAL